MHTFYQQELPFYHISLLAGNTVSVMFPANIMQPSLHAYPANYTSGWMVYTCIPSVIFCNCFIYNQS